jgi:glucose/arabinose dehydrogenase
MLSSFAIALRSCRLTVLWTILTLPLLTVHADAATTLPGFQEEVIATLSRPTGMAFAPDGRLFVMEQAGRIRIIKDKKLLPAPFATFTVNTASSRGLLGMAFDPDFATTRHLFVFYVAPGPRGRISRITASGDSMVAGSEQVLFELDAPRSDEHNGGGLQVGPDGRLYQLIGDDQSSSNAQPLTTLRGKILRINRDGSIPDDNPFFGTATGKYRAIWARGLRNPFTLAFQPGTGRMFVHDVGTSGTAGREEINDGVAGANYGWPGTQGYTTNPSYRSPRLAYGRGSGTTNGCAVVGGTFYNPPVRSFPAEYEGLYFFGDHCNGWINTLDYANGNRITNFARGIGGGDRVGIVDIDIAPDGSLYYVMFKGTLFRIFRGGGAPSITEQPASRTVTIGTRVTFSVAASGNTPLTYQWQRNGANIAGATATSYVVAAASLADNGARFRCRVTNPAGTTSSNEAVLTVTANRPPVASIDLPATGALYRAGDVVAFSGGAVDDEDGALAPAALTWRIDFHHNTHLHPFLPDTSGLASGTFDVLDDATEKDTDVWFRIYLTAQDSDGLTHSVFRDVHPRKTQFTVASVPSGLAFTLDGETRTAPLVIDSVLNMRWTVGAISPQTANGQGYTFDRWSDGGAAAHLVTADGPNTFTATYRSGPTPTPTPATCTTATAGDPWKNHGFAAQAGAFTARVNVTPLSAPIEAFVALSRGPQTALTGFANLIRFNTSGRIDARNGGVYAAAAPIPYGAGVTYRFRLRIDVAARTYSVFVTPDGGAEQTVGLDFAFRTEQAGVASIDNWALRLNSNSGSIRACEFGIDGGPTVTPTPTPTPTSSSAPTPTPTPTPPTGTPTPAGTSLWREAEEAALSAPFAIGTDTAASADRYISVATGNSTGAPPSNGRAVFTFDVTEAGTYKVWGRVSTPNEGADSFWIRMDEAAFAAWNGIPLGTSWHWDDVDDSQNRALLYDLAPGRHTLTVAYREDGARLDRVLITNRLSFTPTGTGP